MGITEEQIIKKINNKYEKIIKNHYRAIAETTKFKKDLIKHIKEDESILELKNNLIWYKGHYNYWRKKYEKLVKKHNKILKDNKGRLIKDYQKAK